MKIYTYGIINSNDILDEAIKGLQAKFVYNIPYHDIGIVASDLIGQIQDITKEHVLEHERVIERLMEKFSILPMRFLTVFDSKADIISMMRDYHRDFRDNLDRLRNKVEFGIKVLWAGDKIKERIVNLYDRTNNQVSISDDSPAKNYIMDKFKNYKIERAFEEEADRCIKGVDKFFSKLVVEKKLEKLKTENLLLNASYLVDKEKQADFKKAFERLITSRNGLKYLLSGPWPPYNFIIITRKSATPGPDGKDLIRQWTK